MVTPLASWACILSIAYFVYEQKLGHVYLCDFLHSVICVCIHDVLYQYHAVLCSMCSVVSILHHVCLSCQCAISVMCYI